MKTKNRLQVLLYIILDFIASYVIWLLFVSLRRTQYQHDFRPLDKQQFVNAAIVATVWVVLYGVTGLYLDPFRRSRFREMGQIFRATALGVLVLFFAIVLDDGFSENNSYRYSFVLFMALQWAGVSAMHLIVTTRTNIRIRQRKLTFPTLVVGCGPRAEKLINDLSGLRHALGYGFKGYLTIGNETDNRLLGKLKHLGTLERLEHVVNSRHIQHIIVALEPGQSDQASTVLELCSPLNVQLHAVPGQYDLLIGSAKPDHVLGTPLISIPIHVMEPWQWVAKRVFDLAFSGLALILLSPLYLALIIAVRTNSPGPAFYRQERIGKNGKPFKIIKFRSMYIDAEKFGPALSQDNDPRITPVGRFLRKSRFDELPQFWNVLKGDMSIVGPRPERQFFIDQIVKRAPHYRQLHKVRPGITSWGQVKYGYASTVDEMVERLSFDILYLENISLALDIKIILYTVIVMIEGRGK